jgi:ATP-dependent Clp protease ATP-binding subunit ClpX
MSSKQPPRADTAAPPVSAAAVILDYGRLLHEEDQRRNTDRNPAHLQEVEEQLIARLSTEKNTLLKSALNFHISNPIDPLTLRVLAVVAYLELCTDWQSVPIGYVAKAVACGEPAEMIEARRTITQLLIAKQLVLRDNTGNCIELGQPMLDLLAGGKQATPLEITERELWRRWNKEKAAEAKRKARASFENLPTAKQIAAKLAESVIGLDEQVRTFACRIALHQRRAALIRTDNDPGSPNETLLFVGPSGCGKTWLAETAGRDCSLPFGAISSTDLTAEGYVGLSVDDAVRAVITAANNDVEVTRYGICFFDEFDKKRTSGWEYGSRDVGGASVQQAVLRLVEGCEFQVGGRRGSFDWYPGNINTRGMCFIFAGAYIGLDELLGKRSTHGIGFGNRQDGSRQQQFLYDALVDYGMIPEFVNRLTGILVFPPPTIEQLVQIAMRSVIAAYRRLLAASGADLQVTSGAIQLMAECALETGTYARGLKTIVARLIEDAVFEERRGAIQFGAAEVTRAVEEAGLASGEARTE